MLVHARFSHSVSVSVHFIRFEHSFDSVCTIYSSLTGLSANEISSRRFTRVACMFYSHLAADVGLFYQD